MLNKVNNLKFYMLILSKKTSVLLSHKFLYLNSKGASHILTNVIQNESIRRLHKTFSTVNYASDMIILKVYNMLTDIIKVIKINKAE